MKKHHLSVEETEDNYQIIAIYTDEQDYRLAFLLNQHLNIKLAKSTSIIDKIKKTDFTVFEYEDTNLFKNWLLLSNQCFVKSKTNSYNTFDLFNDNPAVFEKKAHYLNKYKKINFLLKLIADVDKEHTHNLIDALQQIPQIYTAELILLNKINNKKLLIF